VAEALEDQKYWYGDFYPLSPCNHAPDTFAAYQFHRPDLDAGLVLAFRRAECEYLGVILGLHAITAEVAYTVDFIDANGTMTTRLMNGTDLRSNLQLRLPEKGTSLVVRYSKLKPPDSPSK
jgi:alpha-galactosidase